MFGLKAPNLNPNSNLLNIYIYIYLKLVISKILRIEFVITILLLSHINIAFQSISVWLNLGKSFFKHKSYKYTNVIFRAVIHLF